MIHAGIGKFAISKNNDPTINNGVDNKNPSRMAIKYLYEKTVNDFGETGIPIAVIDPTDYGMMNAKKVLKNAINLIKASKK